MTRKLIELSHSLSQDAEFGTASLYALIIFLYLSMAKIVGVVF